MVWVTDGHAAAAVDVELLRLHELLRALVDEADSGSSFTSNTPYSSQSMLDDRGETQSEA